MALALHPGVLVTAFLGTAAVFACFSAAALVSRRRSYLYLTGGCPAVGQMTAQSYGVVLSRESGLVIVLCLFALCLGTSCRFPQSHGRTREMPFRSRLIEPPCPACSCSSKHLQLSHALQCQLRALQAAPTGLELSLASS